MKKYIISAMMLLAGCTFLASCSTDEPSGESIFKTETTPKNEFDQWLYENFTKPYNIQILYRYNDSETDNLYNVIPTDPEKAKALAIMVRHIWIDAYKEVAGETFIKKYGPKTYQLLGSAQYSSNQSMTLGYAENGVKITLFRINEIDLDDIYVEMTDPFRSHDKLPLDLNHWFFITMHHEFFHILSQTKNYPTTFQEISAGHYHSADWVNVEDTDAPKEGFVTGYGSSEYNEDIAELYAHYVTSTDEKWETLLKAGENDKVGNQTGRQIIEQKLAIVKEYLKASWNIDLDQLRQVVIRRTEEAKTLDLRTLN